MNRFGLFGIFLPSGNILFGFLILRSFVSGRVVWFLKFPVFCIRYYRSIYLSIKLPIHLPSYLAASVCEDEDLPPHLNASK